MRFVSWLGDEKGILHNYDSSFASFEVYEVRVPCSCCPSPNVHIVQLRRPRGVLPLSFVITTHAVELLANPCNVNGGTVDDWHLVSALAAIGDMTKEFHNHQYLNNHNGCSDDDDEEDSDEEKDRVDGAKEAALLDR